MSADALIGMRLLSVVEVADTTGLSESAVYRAIAVGELRASKLRGRLRVRLADLEDWIEANLVSPESNASRSNPHTPHDVCRRDRAEDSGNSCVRKLDSHGSLSELLTWHTTHSSG